MIKRNKAMSLALAALAIAGLSSCTVGMITGAGYPVTVYTGVGVYGGSYSRLGYGYRRGLGSYYGNRYNSYYGAVYGSPIFLDGYGGYGNSSSSCDSRDCPSDVIRPATTQEALLPNLTPQGLNQGLNQELSQDMLQSTGPLQLGNATLNAIKLDPGLSAGLQTPAGK